MNNVVTEQSNTTVTVEQGPNVVVQGNTVTVINRAPNTQIAVVPGPTKIVTLGIQGPAGPPGAGSLIQQQCGTNIATGTVVISSGGLLYPADPTNLTHANAVVGVTTQAGITGQTINVAQGGEISLLGINQDAQYFVGLNGILSTTKIAIGAVWFRYVGLGNVINSLLVVNTPSVFLPS